MRRYFAVVALCTLFLLALSSLGHATDSESAIGAWEGSSTCTVPNSPCANEHVIYEIKGKGDKLSIDAYKIVSGEKQFMGTLECDQNGNKVTCITQTRKRGDWQFIVSGDAMKGTLTLGEERTLYRNVELKRKR